MANVVFWWPEALVFGGAVSIGLETLEPLLFALALWQNNEAQQTVLHEESVSLRWGRKRSSLFGHLSERMVSADLEQLLRIGDGVNVQVVGPELVGLIPVCPRDTFMRGLPVCRNREHGFKLIVKGRVLMELGDQVGILDRRIEEERREHQRRFGRWWRPSHALGWSQRNARNRVRSKSSWIGIVRWGRSLDL